MTREEALNKAINIVRYFEANFAKSKEAREDAVNIIKALEQEPCEDLIKKHQKEKSLAYLQGCSDGIDAVAKVRQQFAEQQPCEDCISRQAVLDLIEHYNSDGLGSIFFGYEEGVKFADAVNKLPPVTPQQKTGQWIDKEDKTAVCSCCNRNNLLYGDFCKWCGTKMESEDKE